MGRTGNARSANFFCPAVLSARGSDVPPSNRHGKPALRRGFLTTRPRTIAPFEARGYVPARRIVLPDGRCATLRPGGPAPGASRSLFLARFRPSPRGPAALGSHDSKLFLTIRSSIPARRSTASTGWSLNRCGLVRYGRYSVSGRRSDPPSGSTAPERGRTPRTGTRRQPAGSCFVSTF